MRIGSLVYATEQGLGLLAKDFYDHGVLTDVMIVEHRHHPNRYDWYPPETPRIPIRPFDIQAALTFCLKMDRMLFFETPFHWALIDMCRSRGIKTFLMPMHECFHRQGFEHLPDAFLCPSLLDMDCFCDGIPGPPFLPRGCKFGGLTYLTPIPVEVPWRLRTKAEVFVHNAGHGGMLGRNGTAELVEAMEMVKSPIKLILRCQDRSFNRLEGTRLDPRIELRVGTFPRESLYEEGDVLIHPEKFNGLSLPLQEARAAGMLVMATDRYPANAWLPMEPLIYADGYRKNRIGPGYLEFDEAVVRPLDIAASIDYWYGENIEAFSWGGKTWAEQNSWERLKPRYMEVLCG